MPQPPNSGDRLDRPASGRQLRLPVNPHLAETCDQADDKAAELVRILDQHLAELKAGHAPSRTELIARHPELASHLEACLAGLEFIHGAETAPGRSQRLGDFRIIREVGRGGMGAVFEAEQVSLGRRVALKILRFGGVSDPEAIERFKREAETIAKLHHTNIVPIFNVGSERGVNYYAMQFIDGQSLAEVLAERKQPLPPEQVAEWGLQASDALTHAHQRGVIHRDVKPSNLLLDKENRLWLTDFGLARRMDDVTLSMTGALLGTPRYMSPEQAAASTKRVDHRSDLFSLGATLYELLTGQPAFPGETPHDVINRILTCEPMPIRQVAKQVPRDLETICMKCLAKEPHQRYGAARDLADDLRAFLDGRPIRARRASLVELATRWLKAQQRSVKLAATAAALTLLLTIASIASWYGYDSWRRASIQLAAARPPLVAEIMDARGKVMRVETAPMQNPASLPAGDYQLRVSGSGTLSQSFDLALVRGQASAYTLDLHDQMLLPPQEIDGSYDVTDFGSEQALVLWNEKGIGLRKRSPSHLGWTREFAQQQLPDPASAQGFRWPWREAGTMYSGCGPYDTRPWVSPHCVDIDGLGTPDLIIAGRHQAWLMAVGGEEAKILWFAPRGHDLAVRAPMSGNYEGSGIKSAVLGTPIWGHDCNADGTPDVIATMVDIGPKPTLDQNRYVCRCWVEAICGKTGKSLWSYDIPAKFFELPVGAEVPYELRCFAGTGGGYTSGGRGGMSFGRHITRNTPHVERTGPHAYRPAAVDMVSIGGRAEIAVVAGQSLVTLDPQTGAVAREPTDVGIRPGRQCRWGDVDGDGTSDLVIISESGAAAFPAAPKTQLVVWSPARQKKLWSKTLDAEWPIQPGMAVESPQWPLVTDLDRNGRCEIIVPDGRYGQGAAGGRIAGWDTPWGILAVYAGDTGQSLWTKRFVTMDQQVNHFLAGPDLDGDGWQEVYAVTLAGTDYRVHVDALSGKTGQTFWTANHAPPPSSNSSRQFHLSPPIWWRSGEDGWPQIITQAKDVEIGQPESLTCAFSAGTGKLLHVAHGIGDVTPADLDKDGAEELLVFSAKSWSSHDKGGTLHAVRGVAAETWRRVGQAGEPAGDLDGDGVVDLVVATGDGTLSATSGCTGALLWREQVGSPGELRFRSARAARSASSSRSGDLNGDGADDLLIWNRVGMHVGKAPLFHAVSGKTGKRLWTADEITIQILNKVLAAEAHDLDGDGRLVVLWLAALDYGYPQRESLSSHDAQLWLFVTSGQSGKLKWAQPLSPAYGTTPGQTMQALIHDVSLSPTVADANGDGVGDIFVPALPVDDRTYETRVFSGTDGKLLWSRPCPRDFNRQLSADDWIPPAVCDLDGDGKQEAVFVELRMQDDAGNLIQPTASIVAVDARSGNQRWKWTSPTPLDYWQPTDGLTKGEVMRPRVLRSGKSCKVAALLPGNTGQVIVVDAAGNAKTRKADYQTSTSGLWVCDADGDGDDELVVASLLSVHLVDVDQPERDVWSQSLETRGHRILDVMPREKGQSPLVAVAISATDNSVLGFDAKTGERLWICGGPIWRDVVQTSYKVPQHVTLLDAGSQQPPHVYYACDDVARLRQAALVPTAASAGVEDSSRTAGRAPAHLAGPIGDDRWLRDLPWVPRYVELPRATAFIGWSLFYGLLLVVTPGFYIFRLAWLRRFSLRMLLLLPVVAALFLTAALMRAPMWDSDFSGFLPRLMIGAFFAPPVVGLGLLAWWGAKGQWRRVAWWLGVSVIISFLSAAILLWQASRFSPLMPEESYDWSGWYLIWFLGAFFTSQIMVSVLPIKCLALLAWKRWRGERRVALPQPETILAAPGSQTSGKT